jgi:uncharacterized protein YndB with AHSA1/START domain
MGTKSDEGKSPMNTATLKISTPSDRVIEMTRVFDAPRQMVFDALTKPELLKLWFLGPPGWSLPVCEIDFRVGGTYRYVWRRSDAKEMGMHGTFLEIVLPERFAVTEVFDDPWYPGDAAGTYVLVQHGGKTTLTLTMQYESRETRDAILRTPWEQGVSANYDRLAELLVAV